jgi:hypothetical protein
MTLGIYAGSLPSMQRQQPCHALSSRGRGGEGKRVRERDCNPHVLHSDWMASFECPSPPPPFNHFLQVDFVGSYFVGGGCARVAPNKFGTASTAAMCVKIYIISCDPISYPVQTGYGWACRPNDTGTMSAFQT